MKLKAFFKRWTPEHRQFKEHPSLHFLGDWLHDSNIWHINRNSTAKAFSVGIFAAFLPLPAQMLLAALGALIFRANLPISVVLTWASNPFTMAPLGYIAYRVGTFILQIPLLPVHFEMSTNWFLNELTIIWKPFLLGCITLGVVIGTLFNVLVRVLWRLSVIWSWQKRKKRNGEPT